ncbi:preprotein translocase subunit SecE [bacterium]|nr:preprotein translocase subunit SecE [bacterium]
MLLTKATRFLKEVNAEMKKVTWPNKKEVIASTIVVIILVFIVAIFVGTMDFFLSIILAILFK